MLTFRTVFMIQKETYLLENHITPDSCEHDVSRPEWNNSTIFVFE